MICTREFPFSSICSSSTHHYNMCGLLLCSSVSLNAQHPHPASLPSTFLYFGAFTKADSFLCITAIVMQKIKNKIFVDVMCPINIISLKLPLSWTHTLRHTQITLNHPPQITLIFFFSRTTDPSIFQCVTQLKLFGHDEMNQLSSALLLGQRCIS